MRRLFKSVFGASSKEVNGVIVLVILFLLTFAIPTFHRLFRPEMQYLSKTDAARLDSLAALFIKAESTAPTVAEKFVFDPNKSTAEELSRLGFKEKAVRQIINYRAKGGQFRSKNDLYKIYSIDSALVRILYAYIDLPVEQEKKQVSGIINNEIADESESVVRSSRSAPVQPIERFDLNKADTSMLQTVRGIGSVLAKRIISFRDKLGGFVNESQLYEVYNLDSVVIDSLLVIGFVNAQAPTRHLNINSLSEDQLAAHPYVSRKQARLIIAYRNQHGNFTSGEDLLAVYLVKGSDIARLQPYLLFE